MARSIGLKEVFYFHLWDRRGQPVGRYYRQFWTEIEEGIPPQTGKQALIRLLDHCKANVPYYKKIMERLDDSYYEDPYQYLMNFPVLKKQDILANFESLKSNDLENRGWMINTTGGSTGEPVDFIHDNDYLARAGAIKLIFSRIICCRFGNKEVFFWGSIHDIRGGTEGWRAKLINRLANRHFLKIFNLDSGTVQKFVHFLNKEQPDLIVGYVWVLDEMAKIIEREKMHMAPQQAIISSAGTLHPEIRERVERVFQCRVYNRYGCREVGDIACERPDMEGLWVAPWGNYVEIVDELGNPLPEGEEGELLVTSLSNYAMPLLRYQIGDRGALRKGDGKWGKGIQVLEKVTGRTVDRFYNRHGRSIDAGYFMPLFFHQDWISRYQVVQITPTRIVIKIVLRAERPPEKKLEEIVRIGRHIMDDDECEIKVEFVESIEHDPSGKFRFIRSEIGRPQDKPLGTG